MSPIQDHPLRYALANELHARPFPSLAAPGQAAYLALKHPQDAASRDRVADRTHLLALLDRFGAKHPPPGATHYFGDLGRFRLKWEQHTEFVTYTVFLAGAPDRAFDPDVFGLFPEDWLAAAPGLCITSALIEVQAMDSVPAMQDKLAEWFVPESLAVSRILDDGAVMAGDFRIDSAGHMRFAVFADPAMGSRRVGRVVQRICEIETYKAMSMLGFARVRDLSGRLGQIDGALEALVEDMTGKVTPAETTLASLLQIAAELESLQAKSSFRFSASAAYEALVGQRIAVLREERFEGRQSFAEFMARRFDPAMRTVRATEARLRSMTGRAVRASDLLRTRVDVDRSAQNQALLKSMDRRADLQLRLQKTVEGLSVVAISYYAVNLAGYLLDPLASGAGVPKPWLTAGLTPVVIVAVFLIVRRVRRTMG